MQAKVKYCENGVPYLPYGTGGTVGPVDLTTFFQNTSEVYGTVALVAGVGHGIAAAKLRNRILAIGSAVALAVGAYLMVMGVTL